MGTPNPRLVYLSGNPSIDGLVSQYAWAQEETGPDGVIPRTFLTYSFPSSAAFYKLGPLDSSPQYFSFQEANVFEKVALKYATELVQSYTRVIFKSIDEKYEEHANIRLANTSLFKNARAEFPQGFFDAQTDGDIWVGDGFWSQSILAGNFGWKMVLHELGHALGLKHGHEESTGPTNTSPALPEWEDHWSNSLMTYRMYQYGPTDDPMSVGMSAPHTYMQNDIATLQYMYGANYDTNAGDTTYTWDPQTGAGYVDGILGVTRVDGKIFETIWDGGGNDTYDLSNFTTDLEIDLNPGLFSTFDKNLLVDLNLANEPGKHMADGNVGNARLYNEDPRSLIENAVGGSGKDWIIGNEVENLLNGSFGNDTLEGDDGNDTLLGGRGDDVLVGGAGNDFINGGIGDDEVQYQGDLRDYVITRTSYGFTIEHIQPQQDEDVQLEGTDILVHVEYIRFGEDRFDLDDLVPQLASGSSNYFVI